MARSPSILRSIGPHYPGLVEAVGQQRADRIMGDIVRMTYDGTSLPADLKKWRPCFLLSPRKMEFPDQNHAFCSG